jgi:acyl-CoA synthetase (AMP-forming)/AMP-acid ligase II
MSGPSDDLRRHARRSPQRTACVDGAAVFTFGQLDALVDELTAALREDAARPGDRVCLVLDNGVSFVACYLAVLRAGAVVVPIDPRSPATSVEDLARDASARLVLCDARRSPELEATPSIDGARDVAGSGAAAAVRLLRCRAREGTPGERGHEARVNGLVSIIYTSGTTGRPKGVMLTARNAATIAEAGDALVRLEPDDRVGLVTPLFHLYGLREVDACLRAGATLVVVKELAYPARSLTQIHDRRVTTLSAVPSGMALVLERYEHLLAPCGEHLRLLTLGTALPPASLLSAIRGCLPRSRLVVTYGLTEASRVCFRELEGDVGDLRAVGRAYPGVSVSVVGEDGKPLAAGQPGRIVVRSSLVMRGYWRRPDLTAGVLLADGSLLTPDQGWLDESGTLFLEGRIDEVINCGGEKVAPQEVEMVLRGHPGIADAAVAGVPDPARVLGELVKAYVVRRPGTRVDPDEVIRHCARRLEPYKVPKAVEFRPSLPRTTLGKVARSRLEDAGR